MTMPEAGWYADPSDPNQERWWDGMGWTSNVRPVGPSSPNYRSSARLASADETRRATEQAAIEELFAPASEHRLDLMAPPGEGPAIPLVPEPPPTTREDRGWREPGQTSGRKPRR